MRSNLRQYFRFNIYNGNISKRNSESTSFISIVMIFTLSDVRVKQQQQTKNGVIFGQDPRRTNLIAAVRACIVSDFCCCHYNISSNSSNSNRICPSTSCKFVFLPCQSSHKFRRGKCGQIGGGAMLVLNLIDYHLQQYSTCW
jgi:hypothetical protein